jgi:hypothetical protein
VRAIWSNRDPSMEFPRARINDVKDNAPADTRATRHSIGIEIDSY